MRYMRLFFIATVIMLSVGVACGGASPTPTQSDASPITVEDVRILTATPAPSPTFSSDPSEPVADAKRGEAIFSEQQCLLCHGVGAEGGLGPALNTTEFQQEFADDSAIADVLRTGLPGMPPYGSDRITDQEIGDLIAYLRSLGGDQAN